jgi:hypothetical protein
MDPRQRERAIRDEILQGNLPEFLRNLAPVQLKYKLEAGKTLIATILVMPEYLAVGSDDDFLRIPMNLPSATTIASRFGFVLPTRKMVDAIYNQARYHFQPEPMPAGPQMRSTEYYRVHNQMIEEQARVRGIPSGSLVAGDKKDVVMSNLWARIQGRITIYGWHRANGAPIQPLSNVHGACYADYSHGIRLVSQTAIVDGQPRPVQELLQDPLLARVLSDEGPIHNLWGFLSPQDSYPAGTPTC